MSDSEILREGAAVRWPAVFAVAGLVRSVWRTAGRGCPCSSWSTSGGDLRIPHFVGIHAIQALPLIAGLAALARRYPVQSSDLVRRRLVRTAVVGYAGVLALVTWQALRRQSIGRPDFWTLSAAAALIVVVAVGAALSLRSPRVLALTEF